MPYLPRSVSGLAVALLLAVVAGCAARPAAMPSAPAPQGDISAEERPEPPTPGVKPLTVEQEEMIAQ